MRLRHFFFGIFVSLLAISIHAQAGRSDVRSDPTRIMGSLDSDVLIPDKPTNPAAHSSDAVALEVLASYLKSINASAWSGMQAVGTFSSPNGSSIVLSPATLTVRDGDSFRLDVQASEGNRSFRIEGGIGQVLESDGKKHVIPPITARSFLVAFPHLLIPGFPEAQTILLDRGLVTIEAGSLHRLTVIETVLLDSLHTQSSTGVLDLYFDPTSHLLVKSAQYVQLDSRDRAHYLQVISYSNYQTVEGVQIPFTISQTLNGQKQWALNLAEVHLHPTLDKSYFRF
jgi:hypothetical protein